MIALSFPPTIPSLPLLHLLARKHAACQVVTLAHQHARPATIQGPCVYCTCTLRRPRNKTNATVSRCRRVADAPRCHRPHAATNRRCHSQLRFINVRMALIITHCGRWHAVARLAELVMVNITDGLTPPLPATHLGWLHSSHLERSDSGWISDIIHCLHYLSLALSLIQSCSIAPRTPAASMFTIRAARCHVLCLHSLTRGAAELDGPVQCAHAARDSCRAQIRGPPHALTFHHARQYCGSLVRVW